MANTQKCATFAHSGWPRKRRKRRRWDTQVELLAERKTLNTRTVICRQIDVGRRPRQDLADAIPVDAKRESNLRRQNRALIVTLVCLYIAQAQPSSASLAMKRSMSVMIQQHAIATKARPEPPQATLDRADRVVRSAPEIRREAPQHPVPDGGNSSRRLSYAVCDINEQRELDGAERQMEQLLAKHYSVELGGADLPSGSSRAPHLAELPRPDNVSVETISWYPPVLKLSWSLHELGEEEIRKLSFYYNESGSRTDKEGNNDGLTNEVIDLDLALGASSQLSEASQSEAPASLIEEFRKRRALLRRSLSCFQVTYNIINSRFKVIEEYPPYLRSITMERLLPATEYSLQVVAVYLNKFRRASRRVEFISPTDNESRRFKENTYRPIHRYPDEEVRELRYGLSQVRGEELTLVVIVLIFWVGTICLFFNKWGKIRMLEPYQPAYRDTADSVASLTGAHHLPSMHNLSVASLLPAPVVSGSSSVGPMNPIVPPGPTSSPILPAGLVGPDQLVDVVPTVQQHQSTLDGKSNRSLTLIAGRRRYETIADGAPVRRTYAELNYLFQSKAQALAKAQIWSRHQSSLQHSGGRNSVAAHQCASLATSRRVSSMLRQRQLSQCLGGSPIQIPQRQSPILQCSLDTGSLERLRDQIRAGRGSATPSAGTVPEPALERASLSTGSRFNSIEKRSSVEQEELESMKQPQVGHKLFEGEQDEKLEQQRANKLRRLLFMSRSHQHHHIATSTSSSITLSANLQQSVYGGVNGSGSVTAPSYNGSTTRPGCYATHGGGSAPLAGCQPGINSVSLDAAGDLAVAAQSRATPAPMATQSSLSSAGSSQSQPGTLRSSVSSLPSGTACQQWTVRRALTPGSRHESASAESRRRVEHHILIEPPSPPNQHESFALSSPVACQDQQVDQERPSICFGEAPPPPSSNSSRRLESEVSPAERWSTCGDAFFKLANQQLHLRQRGLASESPAPDYLVDPPARNQSLGARDSTDLELADTLAPRPRLSSVFVASPYSRAHRDSFAMLRALSQKKSKSAEDVAHLSSLVLQIWARNRNPLLQSVSQNQFEGSAKQKPKSLLTVAHL